MGFDISYNISYKIICKREKILLPFKTLQYERSNYISIDKFVWLLGLFLGAQIIDVNSLSSLAVIRDQIIIGFVDIIDVQSLKIRFQELIV